MHKTLQIDVLPYLLRGHVQDDKQYEMILEVIKNDSLRQIEKERSAQHTASVCLSLYVSLSVCLSVCLSVRVLKACWQSTWRVCTAHMVVFKCYLT